MAEKTLGEARVRTEFNVTNNSTIDLIKQKSAELINICETLKEKDGRLASLAQTAYEEAAMWANAAIARPITWKLHHALVVAIPYRR